MRSGAKPKAIDDYLALVPADARATLETVRRRIQAAAPKATEKISYGIPTFYHQGNLVAFGAFKSHCSFFPMSMAVIKENQRDLKEYATSKGTIRFPIGEPLPAALIKKMVKARISQNEAKTAAKKK